MVPGLSGGIDGGVMELEPTQDERAWVLAQLGALVARRGPTAFVQSLIVQQNPGHFPDGITVSLQGADLIARRLLRYADLDTLDVDVVAYGDDDRARAPAFPGGVDHPTAALFTGIDDGCCRFAVALETFAEPALLVPALAHEVAHAYRAQHGLQVEAHDVDEHLTDLTAVYLGFGVLVANASDYLVTSGWTEGGYAVSRWKSGRLGYLPMPALCFVLAVQVFVRGDHEARAQVRRALAPNQAAAFDASTRWVSDHESEVMAALSLPALDTLPPARPLADLLRPLDNVPEWSPALPSFRARPNQGRELFRVRGHRGHPGLFIGCLLGFWPALWALARQDGLMSLALWVGFSGAGWFIGRRVRADRCSDYECQLLLPLDVGECPGCGGALVAEIASARDRLKAEEARRREREGDLTP